MRDPSVKQAAFGFSVSFGNGLTCCGVFGKRPRTVILARQRVTSLRRFSTNFRQRITLRKRCCLGQAREFILEDAGARQDPRLPAAMRELESRTREQGVNCNAIGLLLASGRPLPSFGKISLPMR